MAVLFRLIQSAALVLSLACVIHGSMTFLSPLQCSGLGGKNFLSSCWTYYSSSVNWATARSNCLALNMNLVSVYSAAENSYVWNTVKNDSAVTMWLGLYAPSTWNTWVWQDLSMFEASHANSAGSTSSTWGLYANWYTGEPSSTGETCGNIYYPATIGWNDWGCSNTGPYACRALLVKSKVDCGLLGGVMTTDTCFFPSGSTTNWVNNEAICRQKGGHLASIRSSTENSLVAAQSWGGGGSAFIGGNDQASETRFVWSDSDTVVFSIGATSQSSAYTSWNSGEPNNSGANENCVQIFSSGAWNDMPCSTNLPGVCRAPLDTTPPTVTNCPSNILAYIPVGSTTVAVTWTVPTATDNTGINTTTITSSPTAGLTTPGSLFPAGTTTVTYTYTDGSSLSTTCQFTVSTSACYDFLPYLDTTNSQANGNNLTLVVAVPTTALSTQLEFIGGNATCFSNNSVTWWQDLGFTNGCVRRYRLTNDVNEVVNKCNFLRDETASGSTTFRGTILITVVESVGSIRGVSINQTFATSVAAVLTFTTTASATSQPLTVFGGAITYAAITSTTFDPLTRVLTLNLLSSAQYPYQLHTPTFPALSTFTTTIVPVTVDSVNTPQQASVCNATGVDTYTNGASCTQTWRLTITPTGSCPTQNNFTADGWGVSWSIRCHSSFSGSCATPSPNSAVTTFSTSSDNYCPRLVSNTATLTATLSTFKDAAYSQAATAYVFGSRTYFVASVTSPIAITNVAVERIWMTDGAASGVTDLYTRTYTGFNFFTTGTGVYNAQSGSASLMNAAPVLMTVSDSSNLTAGFTKSALFSLVWGNTISDATGDNPTNTILAIALRVRFANVTTVGHQEATLIATVPRKSKMGILEEGTVETQATVGVTASSTVTNNGGTTNGGSTDLASDSSSALGLSTGAFVAIVGVIGAIAVAAFVAVAVIHRRNMSDQQRSSSKQEHWQSVQMASASSSAAITASNEEETTSSANTTAV